ncbi:MAG: hydrogenase expression/formation protein HypE [Ruminococcus sp.]|jgi:hydrogenase expression/formation protein HypE
MEEIITLDYGSGGQKTAELIEKLLLPAFDNEALARMGDGAVLPEFSGSPVFSTDSFVVSPWKFPGGDIGKLCVCGTVNDVSMAGGIPVWMSLSLILEEGFLIDDLKEIIRSAADTAKKAGVQIVTGDTKVVERGKGDGIYINTAGIGKQRASGLGREAIRPGDVVLISGPVGNHGAAVMMARAGIAQEGGPVSDCGLLQRLAGKVLDAGGVRILRDPTRGGLATTLNEFTEHAPFSISLSERQIPVEESVRASCELLGLDPLYCACEGRMIVVADSGKADEILQIMRETEEGKNAAQIGLVEEENPGKVILHTALGGRRALRKLTGMMLPRIC